MIKTAIYAEISAFKWDFQTSDMSHLNLVRNVVIHDRCQPAVI